MSRAEAEGPGLRAVGVLMREAFSPRTLSFHLRAEEDLGSRNRAGRWPRRSRKGRSLVGGSFLPCQQSLVCVTSVDSEFQSLI